MTELDRRAPCPCGSGRRYKSCCYAKDRARDAAVEVARVGHEAIEGVVRVVLPLVESSGEEAVACRPGCNYCCKHFVRTSAGEAERIARFLLEPEQEPLRARFSERLASWRARVGPEIAETDAVLAGTRGPDADALVPRFAAAASAHDAREIPCPFLDDQGRCEIYPLRPLPCRAYHAVGDPERCHPASPEPPELVRHPSIEGAFADVRRLLDGAGRNMPGAPTDRALPLAVADALARSPR